MSANSGQTMHWLPRAILLCVGVIFVLFGGLFVAACLAMLGQGANAPAAAKVGVTVQIVTTVVFALVAIAGMFMIWLGVRRGAVASPSPKEAIGVSVSPAAVPHASGPYASGPCCDAAPIPAPEARREFRAQAQPIDAPRAASPTAGEFGSVDADLGQFIARCGPERNGLMYNYVSAGSTS